MSTAVAPRVVGKSFRLGLVQLGGGTSNKEENLSRARDLIATAARGGDTQQPAQLVVLPEVFNSPYAAVDFPKYAETINFSRDAPYDVETSESISIKMLSAAAKDAKVWLVGGSIPERVGDKIYNTSPIFSPAGQLVAIHRKVHLFDISIPGGVTFRESETLTGGDDITIVETDFGKIGVGICYDVRFPELCAIAARKGCVAMIYPGAFNLSTGPLHWDLLMRARATDNQMYVALCSPARATTGDGYKAWGFSGVADPMGRIVAQLDEKEGILYADIDMEEINKTRASIPVTVQRRFDVYPDVSQPTK